MRLPSLLIPILLLPLGSSAVAIPIESDFSKRTNNHEPDYCKKDHKVQRCANDIKKIWGVLATVFCKVYVPPTTVTKTTTVKTTQTVPTKTEVKTITVVTGTETIVTETTVTSTVATVTLASVSLVPATATATSIIETTDRPAVEVVTFTVTPEPILTLPITINLPTLLTPPTLTIPGLPTILPRVVESMGYMNLDAPRPNVLRKRTDKHKNWNGFDGDDVAKACRCILGPPKPKATKTITTTKVKTVNKGKTTIVATSEVEATTRTTATDVEEIIASTDITTLVTTVVDTTTTSTTTTLSTITDYETLNVFYPTSCLRFVSIQDNPMQIYSDLQITVLLDTEDEYEAIMMCAQNCFDQAPATSGSCRAFNIFRAAGMDMYFCTVKIASSGFTTDYSINNFIGVSDSQIFSTDGLPCVPEPTQR